MRQIIRLTRPATLVTLRPTPLLYLQQSHGPLTIDRLPPQMLTPGHPRLRMASVIPPPRTNQGLYKRAYEACSIRSMSAQRPKSRAGLETRPPTAVNRPEGEPPWLATMYKPDPRLPPDQQLLPTHAKRMQQRDEAMRAAKTNGTDGYSDGNINGSSGAGHDPVPLAVHTKDGLRRNHSHSHSPQPSPSPQLDSPASQGEPGL